MGYPAFKIHGRGNAPIAQEVATVLAVGERVGGRMDLMIDPACEYNTFADALKVRPVGDSIYASDYRDGLDAIDGNGCVDVPEGPGLGISYNWDLIERHRTGYIKYEL